MCVIVFCYLLFLYYSVFIFVFYLFFFFKQKTAYEMRISDWSSDVCSSDLLNMPKSQSIPTLTLVDGCPSVSRSDSCRPNRVRPGNVGRSARSVMRVLFQLKPPVRLKSPAPKSGKR